VSELGFEGCREDFSSPTIEEVGWGDGGQRQ
jgi:hypothetical protein